MDGQLRIVDLFCGMGSFNLAAETLDMKCVYACDNDPAVQKVYRAQFGISPDGDIRKIDPQRVPDHDILCAGFPCQPFSRASKRGGSGEDGARVLEQVMAILAAKRPRAFVMENVKGIMTCNNGEDFLRLQEMVAAAGYDFYHQMLRCEDFGIPQTRHRVFMVGFRDGVPANFRYPTPSGKCPTLGQFLDKDIVKPMSNTIRCSGRKSGVDNTKNWSAYRLRDGSVYEYELEDVIKIQGFPEDFDMADISENHRWRLLGNTIPTCLSIAILDAIKKHLLSRPEMPPMPLPRNTADLSSNGDEQSDRESVSSSPPPPAPEPKRKKRPPPVEVSDCEEEERPSSREKRNTLMAITLRSGSTFSMSLPDGSNEETFTLRIIR